MSMMNEYQYFSGNDEAYENAVETELNYLWGTDNKNHAKFISDLWNWGVEKQYDFLLDYMDDDGVAYPGLDKVAVLQLNIFHDEAFRLAEIIMKSHYS